ncbi:Hypothetical predicted protein [Paramuricea clavata]|uniref:Uncharacterized protein n=1 Tax=Paramuricea clavata TaxID=317549 RepID=A0A7D9DZU8_PARCT|nr:Hypothetical predicted protein [Paramuricea clavata]
MDQNRTPGAKQPDIEFYGHIFTANRIKPDPKKMHAIKTVKPQCAIEMKSLLYEWRSIFLDSTLIMPRLQPTTKPDQEGRRLEMERRRTEYHRHFKTSCCRRQIITYFDGTKETKIVVDASPGELGGILMREDKDICYACHKSNQNIPKLREKC